jgi:hypothetical protein
MAGIGGSLCPAGLAPIDLASERDTLLGGNRGGEQRVLETTDLLHALAGGALRFGVAGFAETASELRFNVAKYRFERISSFFGRRSHGWLPVAR